MKKIIYILIALIILGGGYYFWNNKNSTSETDSVIYKNNDYNFSVSLPKSWTGYTIVKSTWQGSSLDANGQNQNSETGPLISIRHPAWTSENPRQDIPIMVFTLKQWSDVQADKFHIGAAPINPSLFGTSANYVFAIPARYNFAYLTGYEEVDQIIHGNNFEDNFR